MNKSTGNTSQANPQGKHMLFLSMGLGVVSVISCFGMAAANMPADPLALTSSTQSVQNTAITASR